MGWIAKDLPTLIFMLLPGFVAAAIFYTLTAHPKTTEFERVIQSLIFTTLIRFLLIPVRALLLAVGRRYHPVAPWNTDVELLWAVFLSFAVGLFFAWLANSDYFHRVTRRWDVNTRTAFPSEWYSAFHRGRRHVVLHLDGERRLRGWPEQWPDQPDKGHFVILDPEWILDDNQAAPLHEVHRLLLPATEVKMVEFLKVHEEVTQEPSEIKRVEELLLTIRSGEGVAKNGVEGTGASTET